jgi:Mrp family chromosome partitioning ATPase
MARQKPSDQVTLIKKQQQELGSKLKEAESKAREETKEVRRRKNELAGAIALKELEANPSGVFASDLRGLLDQTLKREADRVLFDLPALPKQPKDGVVFIPDEQ